MKTWYFFLIFILSLGFPLGAQKGPGGKDRPGPGGPKGPQDRYTIEQSVSDKAQLHTLAFSGLAFLTGTFGADTFLPPGKVADYFGFQYMRDIDKPEKGHNMMFLTNIANNVLIILTPEQRGFLLALAKEQEPLFAALGRLRLPVIQAFRANLENSYPPGTKQLSLSGVKKAVAEIFALDGELSFRRAETYGAVVKTLTTEQKNKLALLKFGDSDTWPQMPEQLDKRGLTHGQDVLMMTYLSEFFSWYAGSSDADVYFCPERHGTYFGGFYMKDYPAIGKMDYFIPTDLTGDSGATLMNILTEDQQSKILAVMEPLQGILKKILQIRRDISTEFRAYLKMASAQKSRVLELSKTYGELDGELSYLYAQAFTQVQRTLTSDQKSALVKMRNQDIFPRGAYLYADEIPLPGNTDLRKFFE